MSGCLLHHRVSGNLGNLFSTAKEFDMDLQPRDQQAQEGPPLERTCGSRFDQSQVLERCTEQIEASRAIATEDERKDRAIQVAHTARSINIRRLE